jgi:hypothetical protein
MRSLALAAALVAAFSLAPRAVHAQAEKTFLLATPYVEKLFEGDGGGHVDVVFLAEGYTRAEMPLFAADSERCLTSMLGSAPWSAHANFRVWRVNTLSTDSGLGGDTCFGCSFGSNGRSINVGYPGNVTAATNLAATGGIGVLICNTSRYGGAAQFTGYATSYNGPLLERVVLHELGHACFQLGDEYQTDGSDRYDDDDPPRPNLTTQRDATRCKWSSFVGTQTAYGETIGTYEGGYVHYATGIFRPVPGGCLMNSLGYDFCPVCLDAGNQRLDMHSRAPVPKGEPTAPTGLQASIDGSSVTLTWSAPASGPAPSSYIVDIGTSPGAADTSETTTADASTTFLVSLPDGAYFARVRSKNASGTSAPSNEVQFTVGAGGSPPAAPTLSVSVSGFIMTLNWTPGPGPLPAKYELEYLTSGSDFFDFASVSRPTPWGFGADPNGGVQTWRFRVKAVGFSGLESTSNEVSATVPSDPPSGTGTDTKTPSPAAPPPASPTATNPIATSGSDRITSTATLNANGQISSQDGGTTLAMQGDGNLVLYSAAGSPLWSSGTAGMGSSHLVMQDDGNLVVYRDSDNGVTWNAGTAGLGPSTLVVQNDGNLMVYINASGQSTWSSGTARATPPAASQGPADPSPAATPDPATASPDPGPAPVTPPSPPPPPAIATSGSDRMTSTSTLAAGATIASQSGSYTLSMQGDGNLVLYDGGFNPLWSSGTASMGSSHLVVQDDGNLVVYRDSDGGVTWSSGTAGTGASTLVVQNDGNLVLYNDASGQSPWSSGTAR